MKKKDEKTIGQQIFDNEIKQLGRSYAAYKRREENMNIKEKPQ